MPINVTRDNLHVLIVEDDNLIRELFNTSLAGELNVQAASNVKDGWNLFQKHTPHIAFVDIGLPDGSGHELAQRMKRLDPKTYIVMITATRDIQNKIDAAANHVNGFLTKPFVKKQVMECISSYRDYNRVSPERIDKGTPSSSSILVDDTLSTITPAERPALGAFVQEVPMEKLPLPTNIRVLIVEDNDMLRELLKSVFVGSHLISAAADLKIGWDLFLTEKPDIVFMDIGLPDGNGHDLVLKMKETNPKTYIIMITASSDIQDKMDAAKNRVGGYLIKPFTRVQVKQCLTRYLDARRQPRGR